MYSWGLPTDLNVTHIKMIRGRCRMATFQLVTMPDPFPGRGYRLSSSKQCSDSERLKKHEHLSALKHQACKS